LSIKKNIGYIKQEISAEEKFLEGFVKIESFWKKYKIHFLGMIAIFVISVVGFGIHHWLEDRNTIISNTALRDLQHTPSKQKSLTLLKESNPRLYALYQLQMSIPSNDLQTLKTLSTHEDSLLKEMAIYHIKSLTQENPSSNQTMPYLTIPLKDFIYLQEAYVFLKEHQFSEAKKRLAMIALNSPVKSLANQLEHYTIKGTQ
jgi:hypothetical protein